MRPFLSFHNLLRSANMAIFRSVSRRTARRPARRSIKARTPYARPRRTIMSVPRGPTNGGFPETLITNMKYSDNVILTSNAGAVVGNIFRMNSLFDPDYTGTGHQPLYFDQFAASYGRYIVMSSKATFKFTPVSASPDAVPLGPYQCGVVGSNLVTFASNRAALAESNNSVMDLMGRDKSGSSVRTLVTTFLPGRDIGLPASDDTVGASVTSNPTSSYYVYAYISDLNNTTSYVQMQVTIEYRVKWYQQGYTAQS